MNRCDQWARAVALGGLAAAACVLCGGVVVLGPSRDHGFVGGPEAVSGLPDDGRIDHGLSSASRVSSSDERIDREADLIELIGVVNEVGAGRADINGDGDVDVMDMADFIRDRRVGE